jgi:putative spermidine/putrescine transport system ATP-binding protein
MHTDGTEPVVGPLASGESPTESGSGTPQQAGGESALSVHGAELSLQRLDKRFGGFAAVSALSLDVAAGEFITLLGASGSGKTTTLLMIAGFHRPDSGSIVLDGAPVTALPPYRRNMGMVFQNYALFPHKTVFENIAFPLRRRGLKRREIATRVDEALDLVHLGDTRSRYPSELSGGQQQRIAVARATVYRPRLLLMDEPLSALDKNLREELQGEIRRIHRDLGTTVVYVTHDQDEALALSDRIVLMRDGSIEQVGTPADVYDRPRTVYAANFLGEINVLHGRVRDAADDGRTTVQLTDGTVVSGTSNGRLAAGAQVAVAVRPEALELSSHGDEGVGVTVDETTFLGRSVRCSGRFATQEPCTMWLDPRSAGVVVGSTGVKVRWATEAATVIDVPAATTMTGGH